MKAGTARQCAPVRGMSLIELMVGLAISMIVILAMLAVYRTTIREVAVAGKGASTDGQRLAGLFTGQVVLQEAGFGIATAVFGSDLVVINNAALDLTTHLLTGTLASTLPASGNAMVWGAKTGATYTCSGLYAPLGGGLLRLSGASCAHATEWNTIVWSASTLIEDSRAVQMTVSSPTGECMSFGIAGAGSLRAKLTTKNSTGLDASSSTCLTNFPKTS